MEIKSSDIKHWRQLNEHLKKNSLPVVPKKLRLSQKLDKYVFNYSFSLRKFHQKDTRGKRLLKKKLKNKSPLTLWNSIVATATAFEYKKLSMSMYGREYFPPPFWQVFPNEMDDLLTPKPVESSEHWIPRYPRVKFTSSNEFSKELIDFLTKPGKEIVVVGENLHNNKNGLDINFSCVDEASDMLDAFAYSNFKNLFDVQPNTIAVVSYSRRMYDEFIESYPDFLKPAFIQIYEANQHKGRTFTDYHVLDCPSFLSNTAYDLKYYVRRPFYKHEIYNFRGFRFLMKPKVLTEKTIFPKPLF
ncbi:hypothetical protein ACTS9E_15190 [Empedobacter brevis]